MGVKVLAGIGLMLFIIGILKLCGWDIDRQCSKEDCDGCIYNDSCNKESEG